MPDIQPSTPEPGSTLDHYRLEAVVARGGMSTLYRARDLTSDRIVALKLPHPEMEGDPVLVERFRREEQIGQQLDHPGIVKTFNGEERCRKYMVIEWVEGDLLRSVLQHGLDVDRATHIILGICDALDYMHKRGVVHRDLKPENILVEGEDQIKLIDFGVAGDAAARRLTIAGSAAALGSLNYLAPEQALGERGDERTDLYATGVLFYEMLTGHPPFCGATPAELIANRLHAHPMPPRLANPAISPQLQEILYRALERRPQRRYRATREFLWDLQHIEEVKVINRTELTDWTRQRRQTRMRLLYFAGLSLVPLAFLALAAMILRCR